VSETLKSWHTFGAEDLPIRELYQGYSMKYTRFERARIIGARALQISMGAPILLEVPKNVIDPLGIAELEFQTGVIPITVRRAL